MKKKMHSIKIYIYGVQSLRTEVGEGEEMRKKLKWASWKKFKNMRETKKKNGFMKFVIISILYDRCTMYNRNIRKENRIKIFSYKKAYSTE